MDKEGLRKAIQDKMKKCQWNRQPQKFLPDRYQKELISLAAIKACMPSISHDLATFITTQAPRVLLILLHSECRALDAVLPLCAKYDFTDKKLPIPEAPEADDSDSSSSNLSNYERHLKVFATQGLGSWGWDDFYRHQWYFLVPVFSIDKFEYRFPFGTLLPITKYGKGSERGHFGVVEEALLYADHLRGFPGSKNGSRRVAIKTFRGQARGTSRELTAEDVWRAEKEPFTEMQQHKHLIECLAAVSVGEQYFLISEWADGGDLETFWKNNENVQRDGKLVDDVLEQFQGLADALRSLHRARRTSSWMSKDDTASFTSPAGPSIPGIRVPSRANTGHDSTDNSNWRHGDLKPANILITLDASSRLGTLKIADLGLAKKHPMATGFRNAPSSTEYGTQAYEPPEVITRSREPRSRLYDIWSFGCVLLEMVVWLLHGHEEGLDRFYSSKPQAPEAWETLYYKILNDESAEVNSYVRQVINSLLEDDPECNSPQGSAIRDLLILVRDKLLVVALPGTKEATATGRERIGADDLWEELEDIKTKAKRFGPAEHNPYLWTGKDRTNARLRLPIKAPQMSSRDHLLPEPLAPVGRGATSRTGPNLHPPRRQHPSEDDRNLGRLPMRGPNQRETYTHEPLDPKEWTFALDNAFATRAVDEIMNISAMSQRMEDSVFCQRCQSMLEHALSRRKVSCADIGEASPPCSLCSLLNCVLFDKPMESTQTTSDIDAVVSRAGSKMVFELATGGKRTLSIGQLPGHDVDAAQRGIQISLPHLAEMGTAHAALLRAWLRDCDDNHDCWHSSDQTKLPTRLIEIGTNPTTVRLVESAKLTGHKPRFAALSYPWGDSSAHQHYFTTVANYERHKQKILTAALPTLLRDAIRVTRDIGIGYIWIDALCIKQGPDGDFNYEAERMEDVFSAAYCVLAASRSSGVSDGFLGPRKQRQAVAMPGSSLFLCEDIDDYQRDVIEGDLNKRGWVLQERALARRTIYFTKNQTYWECGRGVRCETFSKMSNKQAAFLGDSEFPRMAARDTKGSKILLFESLYEQYSRLHFSQDHDKPIAIAGLERRLCSAFDTNGGFGLFDKYFERSILWQRATLDVEGLTKIAFPSKQAHVPSWSWMAYRGGIKFMDLSFDGIEWMKDEYISPWALSSSTSSRTTTRSVRERTNSKFAVMARNFDLGSSSEDDRTSKITWDCGAPADGPFKCVAIGKLRAEAGSSMQTHYVLILRSLDNTDAFERVGVGCLPKAKIDFSGTHQWSRVR